MTTIHILGIEGLSQRIYEKSIQAFGVRTNDTEAKLVGIHLTLEQAVPLLQKFHRNEPIEVVVGDKQWTFLIRAEMLKKEKAI